MTTGAWAYANGGLSTTVTQTMTETVAVPHGPGSDMIRPERVFARGSFWSDNPLPADAPLHPSSDTWAANLRTQLGLSTTIYNGRLTTAAGAVPGQAWFNLDQGAVPVYVVPFDQPRVPVAVVDYVNNNLWSPTVTTLHEALMQGVPIPPAANVDPSGDHSLVIYQPTTDSLWEFWVANNSGGTDNKGRAYQWTCKWGGRMLNCSTRGGTFRDDPANLECANYGHAATGLPMLGGMITPEEWASDDPRAIRHPLRLLVGDSGKATASGPNYLAPAHRGDGDKDETWIPEGARIRLAANADLTYLTGGHYPGLQAVDDHGINILKLALALRDYGAFVTDITHGGCALQFRSPQSYYWQGLPSPFDLHGWQPSDYMWRLPWQYTQALDPSVSPE